MHRLRSVLQRQRVVTAAPNASVHEVAAQMAEAQIGAIPVLENGRLIGIFSERDLMTRVVVPRLDPDETSVADVMTREVVTATLQEHVDYCVEKMRTTGCRHLPVMGEGRLIGVVSMRDLLRDEIAEQTTEIRGLKAYLHSHPV